MALEMIGKGSQYAFNSADKDGADVLRPRGARRQEANWTQTVPGKGWFMILRLYGPLDPWFDKAWRPGNIDRVE